MTTMTDPPGQGFRLSQLIYDTRYRSLTIQVVAMVLLMLLFSWLVSNTIHNLQNLGKDFDFGFLTQPSGYDINQRLIEYNSQMTHGRAALVGILNTILVAFLGCALATVLGVVAGVLRLSNNWLVSRLMSVYVEGFRNVPLLLWIVLIFALMTESTPAPRAFRGDDATASMLFDAIAVTNRGVYTPAIHFGTPFFANGFFNWLVVILVLGASLYAIRRLHHWATERQEATGDRPTTWYFTLGLLILPTAILMVLMSAYLNLPELKGFNFGGGIHLRNSLIALWLALSLYTGAFIAEIVRGGILAVSKGQTEAAYALGLRPSTTMNLVILPQALRVIIPPLISQFLNLTKNSSLAIAVGYMDVRSTLGGITINQTGRELEGMLLLGLFYLVLSLLISGAMNIYNASVKLKER
ncbi:ABC transporter permease subunit [Salipiger sp. P9]|uniref:amino acid ABC transporter permease n=1 Tax=Salipiger pentaromativorans TaxID=2943193 RepID=UPI0021582D46|nr:ABC transporter permease subunit [Salipiger pentaromativorans]MCR8550940.1 ABC transporter permease subunit [Salipiger pentaromativorans]